MNNENAPSASSSATTSTSGQSPRVPAKGPLTEAPPQAPKQAPAKHPAVKVDLCDHTKLSEADFLAKEANDARTAISAMTSEIASGVGAAIDPRPLVGKHPWISLGAAAVAGFTAATMLTPSRQDVAISKLEKLSKALRAAMGEKVSQEAKVDASDNHEEKKSSGDGIVGMIFHNLVKPAVTAAIASKMAPQQQPPPAATNGSAQAPVPEGPSMG